MKKLMRRVAAFALLICLIMTQTVCAAVNNEEVYTITTNDTEGWPEGAEVYSETAILMDADTGTILYNKGMDEARYPASITKIMTTLLALENTSLTDEVTFTETGLARITEGSNLNMQVGEVLTMEQCLYAIMLKSANEVAEQVGEYIAGSTEAFADLMNERAAELGCTGTHFTNASGLPDEEHYTTAHDMALIFQEALKNETFVEIIGTLSYVIPATNLTAEQRTVSSHHPLLVPTADEYYEGTIGGKTGSTDASLNTLVTAVERDGRTLIAVVMRASSGEVAADSIALFDYGFTNFENIEVDGGMLTVPVGVTVDDLENTSEEQEDGTILTVYTYGGYTVGTAVTETADETDTDSDSDSEDTTDTEETTEEELAAAEELAAKETALQESYERIMIVLAVLIVLLLLVVIITMIVKGVKNREKRKRKKQQEREEKERLKEEKRLKKLAKQEKRQERKKKK